MLILDEGKKDLYSYVFDHNSNGTHVLFICGKCGAKWVEKKFHCEDIYKGSGVEFYLESCPTCNDKTINEPYTYDFLTKEDILNLYEAGVTLDYGRRR